MATDTSYQLRMPAPVGRRLVMVVQIVCSPAGLYKNFKLSDNGRKKRVGWLSEQELSCRRVRWAWSKGSVSFIDPAWISPLESIEGKAGRFGKQKDLYTWRQVSMLTLEPDEQAPSGRHTFLLGLWLINICHALREKPRSFQSPARGSPSQSSSNQTGSTDVCT